MYQLNTFGKDLTSGSIPKNLFKFALPVFLANILSSGYAIINTIWVGHLLGGVAVAAVAVTFPVFLFMVAIANGATTATSVMISHNFGAKNNDAIQKIVDTSWGVGIIVIIFTCISGYLGAETILRLMNTSSEVLAIATGFLRLTIIQFVFMYLGFMFASTLRAVGNSKIPLMFTALGTVLNTILDPLLIIGVGPFPKLGLNGAAYASLFSGGITSIIGLIYFWKKYNHTPLVPKSLTLTPLYVKQTFGIGFPTFIQQTLISISVAFVTVFVNRFGADATAAFGIIGRVESLIIMPAIAMLVAVSTLTAQTIGAKKTDAVPVIYKWGLIINTPVIALICLIAVLFPVSVMRLFVNDPKVISIGVEYLYIAGWAYLLMIVTFVTNGVLIGAKKAMITMVLSIISLGIFRIPLAAFLSNTTLGLKGIWIAIAISFFVNALLGFLFYISGRWKKGTELPVSDTETLIVEAEVEGAEVVSNV
jgi:putative MATE family efflux protein